MNRRDFILSSGAVALASRCDLKGLQARRDNRFSAHVLETVPYIEEVPVPEYRWVSAAAYESLRDMKFGARIHWVSIPSFPILAMHPGHF